MNVLSIDSLQTGLGCDRWFLLNLIVNPSYQLKTNETICSGDNIFFDGTFIHVVVNYMSSTQKN